MPVKEQTVNQLSSTNPHLIHRLLDPKDQSAWCDFIEIYESTILNIAKKIGLRNSDTADATQEVLAHVSKVISKWRPDGKPKSFRRWLYRVSRNKMLTFVTRSKACCGNSITPNIYAIKPDQIEAIEESSLWDIELRRQVLCVAVRRIRDSFSHKTWQAFWLTYIDGVDKTEAANRLNMSIGAVYIARSRIMNRLQSEVKQLIDDDLDIFADGFDASLSSIREISHQTSRDPSLHIKANK